MECITTGDGVLLGRVSNSTKRRPNHRHAPGATALSAATGAIIIAETSSSNTAQTTNAFAPTKALFTKHEPHIVAIKREQPREARVDLYAVFVRTLPVLGAIREMRPQVVQRLSDVDLTLYDSIEERVYAAHYCNTLWQSKVNNKENVSELADALEDRYDDALFAVRSLVQFRLISGEPLTRLKPAGSHDSLEENAGLVLGVLRRLPPELLSQTPLKPGDLELLEHDLIAFQTAWGRREYAEQARDEAAILRAQAFTYLYDAYEVARRAAFYLHGYERGNELVPSLFATNGERRRKGGQAAPEGRETSAPVAGNGGAGADNGASASKNGVVTPANFVMDNTANLPLTNPFDLIEDKK